MNEKTFNKLSKILKVSDELVNKHKEANPSVSITSDCSSINIEFKHDVELSLQENFIEEFEQAYFNTFYTKLENKITCRLWTSDIIEPIDFSKADYVYNYQIYNDGDYKNE